jgi:hypothetical protein
MLAACAKYNAKVVEYTVAPEVNPIDGSTPYHEWFVEFSQAPKDINIFCKELDSQLSRKNIYYWNEL